MTDGEIEAELLNQIRLLSDRSSEIDGSTELIESGVLDSFAVLELLAFASEKFNAQFSPEDIVSDNIRTVNALARLVRQRL